MLDYDVNMALVMVNRHLAALFRIQYYNHPGLHASPALMQV